jgi:mono/diheme cytochrome c family protein
MKSLAWLGATLLLAGCGSYTLDPESAPTGGGPGNGGGAVKVDNCDQLFSLRVQPRLAFCRNCHVPGGVADVEDGRLYMLSQSAAEDFANLRASWERLGRNDSGKSRILRMASGTDTRSHTGGTPWPEGSDAYREMDALLLGFVTPSACALGNLGGTVAELPLLGDLQANGGRNYAAVFCEGKGDDVALPRDPRELIAGENLENPGYAVWFNDAFELCETETLFENQRRQNQILVARGEKPIYSAKARPKNCGEWRTAVESGRDYIMRNPITGAVITREAFYKIIEVANGGFLNQGGTFPATPQEANAFIAKTSQQRYGYPPHPYDNPFPMPGEDPNATNGGSIQLPIALVQVKDENGRWTGQLGNTCFACHVGQIGTGEVVGNSAQRDGHPELYGGSASGMFVSLNGSNTDPGLALWDIEQANLGPVGPDSFGTALNTPGYMANRTRGTNAADQEIVNVLLMRDLDSLDWRGNVPYAERLTKLVPSAPLAGGDQDMPTWWWTHNKSRYLWVGFGSSGSSRGNFFPSSTNPNDGHWSKAREGAYQDLDMWLNAVEAPAFVGPPVDRALAEQGAILFHSKDLWDGDRNADIPRPPGGNGSCAGCHGAYSPRYIHQPGFLPDPALAGMSGYTVPLAIVGTDPAQSDLFTLGSYNGVSNPAGGRSVGGAIANSWFGYPDAKPGYRLPEEKSALEEFTDDFGPAAPGACALGTKGGYTAQPLHGVWASGPYFHNGSVPTVWDVLNPADRPNVWRRQLVPGEEAAPTGDRGFDTRLDRAYDYEKLGWKYERLTCDARTDLTAVSCRIDQVVPTALDLILLPYKVIADYFTPPYLLSPTEPSVADRAIFNTHAYSKSNAGHEFTKALTDIERKALVEYLKTL